jgi:hypothetical protein
MAKPQLYDIYEGDVLIAEARTAQFVAEVLAAHPDREFTTWLRVGF